MLPVWFLVRPALLALQAWSAKHHLAPAAQSVDLGITNPALALKTVTNAKQIFLSLAPNQHNVCHVQQGQPLMACWGVLTAPSVFVALTVITQEVDAKSVPWDSNALETHP